MKKVQSICCKVVSCFTIFAAMLTGTVNAVSTPVSGWNNSDRTLLLNRIGISAVYDENAYITRGDFTVLAVQAMDAGIIDSENIFDDISGEQAKYINTAVQISLVSKSDDKRFYPDNIIKAEEAAAICLRMLGYGNVINGADAYPKKYLEYASRLKLSDKIAVGAYITGADAAKMIFNTLDTEYLDYTVGTNTSKNEYALSGKTYLSDKFGVRKYSGTITSVHNNALNGFSAAAKQKIKIGSVVYNNPYYGGFGYYTYLGRSVEYYTKEKNGETEIVYIRDKSTPEVVDFKDVTNVRGFNAGDTEIDRRMPKMSYLDENGGKKTADIKPDATILINGEKRLSITNEDFDLPSGKVTLTDNNDDGIYDVVCVEQHTYYRVAHFDRSTEKLEVEDGYILADLSKFDKSSIAYLSGDKEVGSEIIAEDSVIRVMCSFDEHGNVDTDKMIAISVSTQIAEGIIEYVDADKKICVGGKEYRVLPKIFDELKNKAGKSTVFYLGADDLIVDFKPFKEKEALIYAYLVKAADDGTVSHKYKFLVYSENEKMEVLTAAKNLKYTGIYNGNYVSGKTLKENEVLGVIQTKQLIRYKLNETGEADLIETAYDYSTETGYKGFDENRFSLDYASDGAFIYHRYVGPSYKSNANTVYFYVSSTSEDEADFACHTYIDMGYTVDGAKVKIYDSDTFLQPTIVVITDYPSGAKRLQDNCGSIGVVTNKRTGVNKDGDWVTQFSTFNGNNLNTYIAKSDDIKPLNKAHYNIPTTVTKISEIKNGDIIKYGRRKDGEIDRFIVVSEYDKTHTDTSWGAYANDFPSYPYMAEISYVKGKVTSFVPKSHLTVECTDQRFVFSRSGLTYLEYDVAQDKLTRSSALPRLTVGDYVWFLASRNEINTLVRYID